MQLTKLMKHIDLFRGLDEPQLERLASISQEENYALDETIFSQGSAGDKMYIISQGQVEIQVRDTGGAVHSVLYLGQGQVFGEMALLDRGQRSASVLAAQDGTVVYSVGSATFNDLCAADTAIGFIMMRNLALDLSFKLRHANSAPSTSF
jgi:CRP-like cAMP-binding protein